MARYRLTPSADKVYDYLLIGYIYDSTSDQNWQTYQEWLAEGNTPDPSWSAEQIEAQAWNDLRAERDRLLRATDFMMVYDYYNNKMTGQEQTDVIAYREALRDLPGNTADPENPTWPTKPQILIDNGI